MKICIGCTTCNRDLAYKLMIIGGQLCDAEWRIFKEWQRVIPDEPFEAYKKHSLIKRAMREGINTDNVI